MPEPVSPAPSSGASSTARKTPRRCRINHKYKNRRASCPLAFEQPLPGRLYRSRSEIMEDSASMSSGSAAGHSSMATTEEVLLRIHVPELKVEKCMQFHKDDLVWEVKQNAMSNLPKELREPFNYGLFCPPQNGRAGKFLDEERPLMDYPFSSPVGYLELKYKRRVYKMLHIDEKTLRSLHTKAGLKRFLEFTKDANVEKISKLCMKGLDPNFHCIESGETPLTIAIKSKKCSRMVLTLVNGGALLDYRTRDGLTPMHKAVQCNNYEALKTLLDLGASPNYRDLRGLTPLYYTVTHATDPIICQALLHDYANIGACDAQGWHEVHQACRNKLIQHLEHLLFYGADMNAQNASGNTSLHVCAVNNLEDCARVLLFRGCDKNALNYANQTPYQVAVIAGNMDLAKIIQSHTLNDVVPFKEPPKFNKKRRISNIPLSRAHSDPRLEQCAPTKPPSPSPSNRSIPPFSSASSLSETSSGSTCTHPSEMDSDASAMGSTINPANENSDIVSDSSGVCTSNSNESYDSTVGANSTCSTVAVPELNNFNPGMLVVCLKNYNPTLPGHLKLNLGEIIEVVASTDDGYLEGCLKGKIGLFPPNCVQEVRLRDPKSFRNNVIGSPLSRGSSQSERSAYQGQIYGTTPRTRKLANEPRTVILHRGKKGFGFVLRGAKATSPLIEKPYERGPALQYLDDVDPGGVADEAGLKKGDYLLRINGEDVSQASHEHVVNIIKKSGDLVQMVVLSPVPGTLHYSPSIQSAPGRRGCQTLPRKFNAGKSTQPPPAPPPRDPKTTLSVGRARARSMVAGLQEIDALGMFDNGDPMSRSAYEMSSNGSNSHCGMKIASIKPRPSSKGPYQEGCLIGSPTGRQPRVYASVAEMKKAKALKSRTAIDQTRIHRDFSSTPDLQRVPVPRYASVSMEDKRKSISQEDLFIALNMVEPQNSQAYSSQYANSLDRRRYPYHDESSVDDGHHRLRRSLSAVNAYQLKTGGQPPPVHPPPPVPLGQVVQVETRSDYAAVGQNSEEKFSGSSISPPMSPSVMSSFRPSDSAKLYASPEEIKTFGFKKNEAQARKSSAKNRSQSLPPAANRLQGTKNTHKETSGDSGVYSATYSSVRNQSDDSVNIQPHVDSHGPYARPNPVPQNNAPASNVNQPRIPDPDYSSEDESSYSIREDPPKKLRTLKKKKQTVAFAPTTSEADTPHYAAPAQKTPVDTNNFADLIAKKAAERIARQESGGSAPTSATSSPNKRKSNADQPLCLSDAIAKSDLFNRQRQKTVENPTASKVPPATAPKTSVTREDVRQKLKLSNSCPKEFATEDGDNSSSGVSSDQEHAQSESYVTVINTESNAILDQKSKISRQMPRDDSSEASSSSDEASDRTWILTNDKGDRSDSGKDSDSSTSSKRSGTLTRNAVSLVKLPPPQETTEPDVDMDNGISARMSRSVEHDTISTLSSLSSLSSGSSGDGYNNSRSISSSSSSQPSVIHYPKQDYGTVPASQGIRAALNNERRRPQYSADAESISKGRQKPALLASRSATLDRNFFNSHKNTDVNAKYERSIDESLQLIRMHMNSLNEVNTLAGIPGAKSSSEMVLAPPPEFSDSSQPYSRAGGAKGRTVIHIASNRTDSEPARMIKRDMYSVEDKRSFRNKTLSEWTTKDTTEWLESLFMPEYKESFSDHDIDGRKLLRLNNDALLSLGIRKIGHRVKIEKSLKKYRPMERIDL